MARYVSEEAKQRTRERARKWRAENIERAREAVRIYAAAHREEARKRTREWQLANPDKVRDHSKLRHERVKNAPISDLTDSQWQAILREHGGRCAYCGTDRDVGQDHVIPLARGGPHTASNVVPSCFPCNNRKALNDAPLPQPPAWMRVRAERES
jgi:5-methylcytosine-specific restriction endonuclease McrA